MHLSNETIWLLLLTVDFIFATAAIYLFKRIGLYLIIIFSILVCNLQVLKIVSLWGMPVTLGNVAYGSIFLATGLLSECYGVKEAKKGVLVGFFVLISFTLIMQLTTMLAPLETSTKTLMLDAILKQTPKITIASFTAFLCAQYSDVLLFDFMKRLTNSKYLWLRNNIATLCAQTFDTLIFTLIVFANDNSIALLRDIFVTTMLFKAVVAIINTPFMYLGKKILLQDASSVIVPQQQGQKAKYA